MDGSHAVWRAAKMLHLRVGKVLTNPPKYVFCVSIPNTIKLPQARSADWWEVRQSLLDFLVEAGASLFFGFLENIHGYPRP